MRIVDKRRDYYDGVMPFSDSPVWVRTKSKESFRKTTDFTREEKDQIKGLYRDIPKPHRRVDTGIQIRPYIIGFCGGLYITYRIRKGFDDVFAKNPSDLCEKYNKLIGHGFKPIKPIKPEKPKDIWYRRTFNDKSFQSMIDSMSNQLFYDISIKLGVPVFSIYQNLSGMVFEKNPILKNCGFQIIFNPWDAYQELEYFIGNVLTTRENDKFDMSDELKRDSKGMDNWSFKQRGPKPRKQKKG